MPLGRAGTPGWDGAVWGGRGVSAIKHPWSDASQTGTWRSSCEPQSRHPRPLQGHRACPGTQHPAGGKRPTPVPGCAGSSPPRCRGRFPAPGCRASPACLAGGNSSRGQFAGSEIPRAASAACVSPCVSPHPWHAGISRARRGSLNVPGASGPRKPLDLPAGAEPAAGSQIAWLLFP